MTTRNTYRNSYRNSYRASTGLKFGGGGGGGGGIVTDLAASYTDAILIAGMPANLGGVTENTGWVGTNDTIMGVRRVGSAITYWGQSGFTPEATDLQDWVAATGAEGRVYYFKDRTGNGITLTQAGAGEPYVVESSLQHPYKMVHCVTGRGFSFENGSITFNDHIGKKRTFATLMKFDSFPGGFYCFNTDNGTYGGMRILITEAAGVTNFQIYGRQHNSTATHYWASWQIPRQVSVTGEYFVLSATVDAVTNVLSRSKLQMYLNGVSLGEPATEHGVATGISGNPPGTKLALGYRADAWSGSFLSDVFVGTMMVFDHTVSGFMSDADMLQLSNSIRTAHGLTY